MTRITLSTEALARLDDVLAAPAGRPIGLLGLGVAGRAMALHLARRGARVIAADRRRDVEREALEAAGVELRLGSSDATTFADVEALVVSPGADPTQPAVRAPLARGVPICGELELAGRLPARVVAITGTNGKSTTTALVGALLEAVGLRTFVGGNLGDPVVAWLDRDEPVDVAVVELSSYQLETAYRFRADVGLVLNVTPDHFDRYPNVESYAHAKQRLIENLGADGVAVLNRDDMRVAAMATKTQAATWWFSTALTTVSGDGAALRGNLMVPAGRMQAIGELDLTHARLFGVHNRENALAAFVAVAALGYGGPDHRQALLDGYRRFVGLEHRLELVDEVGGVCFVNDSKATNDDAAAIGVQAMDRPIVLLAGGRGKGAGYDRLVEAAEGRVRAVVAFGEDRQAIAAAFAGRAEVALCEDLEASFVAAVERAEPGETVLLAPACASFDQFESYVERGRAFKALVRRHAGEKS